MVDVLIAHCILDCQTMNVLNAHQTCLLLQMELVLHAQLAKRPSTKESALMSSNHACLDKRELVLLNVKTAHFILGLKTTNVFHAQETNLHHQQVCAHHAHQARLQRIRELVKILFWNVVRDKEESATLNVLIAHFSQDYHQIREDAFLAQLTWLYLQQVFAQHAQLVRELLIKEDALISKLSALQDKEESAILFVLIAHSILDYLLMEDLVLDAHQTSWLLH
jgi:hypothetical protein